MKKIFLILLLAPLLGISQVYEHSTEVQLTQVNALSESSPVSSVDLLVLSPFSGLIRKVNSDLLQLDELDPIFTISEAALFQSGDKTKLDGIETNATADQNASEVPVTFVPNTYSPLSQNVEEHLIGIDNYVASLPNYSFNNGTRLDGSIIKLGSNITENTTQQVNRGFFYEYLTEDQNLSLRVKTAAFLSGQKDSIVLKASNQRLELTPDSLSIVNNNNDYITVDSSKASIGSSSGDKLTLNSSGTVFTSGDGSGIQYSEDITNTLKSNSLITKNSLGQLAENTMDFRSLGLTINTLSDGLNIRDIDIRESDGKRAFLTNVTNLTSTVHQVELRDAYLLSSYEYNSVSFSMETEDDTMVGIVVNSAGTKFIALGRTTESFYEYTISTPWDLSTATYSGNSFNIGAQVSNVFGLTINSAGTRIIVVDNGTDSLYQYNLSTAFDLTTASYSGNSFLLDYSASPSPTSVANNSDERFIYVTDNLTDEVYQLSIDSFQLSTANLTGFSNDLSSFSADPYIAFSTATDYMYVNTDAFSRDIFTFINFNSNSAETIYDFARYEIGTGYADYTDTQYTSASPLAIPANTSTTITNNAGTVFTAQLPLDVDQLYDSSTNTITGRNGDGICWTIEMKVLPSVAAESVTLSVDIGGAVGEIYPATYGFPKGSGVERPIIYAIPQAYTLGTFEANGGTVKIVSDAAIDVYDIRFVIGRTHKAR